ncbi:MAG: FAD:protein FMN transferase [Kiritimatiellia bacterium]
MKNTSSARLLWILAFLALLGTALLVYDTHRMPSGAETTWRGQTMGTTYEIKLAGVRLKRDELVAIQRRVSDELVAVNDAMSTYIPGSEISRFNRLAAGTPLVIGGRFRDVIGKSFEVFEITGGVFDPTLGVLIDLWGFGAGSSAGAPAPTEMEIAGGLGKMGFENIHLTDEGLSKEHEGLEINLSAIAKGYGVDRVADLLVKEGFQNVYVEIGGELVCRGVNPNGIPWRIGIQVPKPGAEATAMRVLSLHNWALATTGDYRNFLEEGGKRRHHILDPRTGRPAEHRLASVSVLASDCMTADAVATALYVMGSEEGMDWLEGHPELDALFIDRDADEFILISTPGFEEALISLP